MVAFQEIEKSRRALIPSLDKNEDKEGKKVTYSTGSSLLCFVRFGTQSS